MNKIFRKILNTIDVPEDLEAITFIDRESEVDPESVELSSEGADKIWQSVVDLYQTGTHPAIQLCLRRKGKIVFNRSIGHLRGNGPHDSANTPKVPLTTDSPVCLFSASKAITAVLVHILTEDESIKLMDPVSYYLPEFARNGKKNINIHQILSHRGGIPGLSTNLALETLWDEAKIWKLLCDARPIAVDGAQLAYHAITGGYVLGRLIKKVTGHSIQTYLDEKIRQPMGMKYFRYGIKPEQSKELAENYCTGPLPLFPVSWVVKRALGADIETVTKIANDPRFQETVIPAGNLVGTAEEVSRFFQMMVNKGSWNGKRICDPMTIRRVTQEFGSLQLDRTMMLPMRYSAGLMLGGDPVGIWGKMSGSAYGHLGLINKLAWGDDDREISVGLMTSGIPILAHHLPQMVKFVNYVSKYCTKTASTSSGL